MPRDGAAKPAYGRAPIGCKDSAVEHDRAAARALPQCRSTIRESTRT